MGLWSTSKKHYLNQVGFEQQEQPKRISTSAGARLSSVLDSGASNHVTKPREAHRASLRKGGLNPILAGVPEDRSPSAHSSGYSENLWSEEEKFAALRNHERTTKRGGWKRILIIVLLLLLLIIALGVGLGLGLKKKKSDSSVPSSTADSTTSASDVSPTSASISTAQPSNFPLGSYSLVTFLDTVQTTCTANPSTWTCYPYTTYYSDTSKSIATFDWVISGSKGAYKISSADNPFNITFKNEDLDLLDEGKESERYHFYLSQTRTVSPTTNLTEDNASVSCDFANTNLQASLYTKRAKEYPSDKDPSGNPSSTTWPYAVRVEQLAAGGANVPSCYKTLSNGQHGAQVTDGLDAQDESTLCSCLYKNWHTPS